LRSTDTERELLEGTAVSPAAWTDPDPNPDDYDAELPKLDPRH
jgi:hypothetical protein